MASASSDAAPVERTGIDLSLEEFLPYRLNVLASQVSQGFARSCADRFGVSIPEWRVVAMLGQRGRLTSKEIGEHSGMHKTMVSRAVSELERRQLIDRETNAADKREVFLALTPRGRTIYAEILPLAGAYTAKLTVDFSPADRAALDRLLKLLSARAGRPPATGGPA